MLFVHDHKFIEKDGAYYTTGSLNNQLFKRYLDIFSEVEVLANSIIHNNSENIIEKNRVNNVRLLLIKSTNWINKIRYAKKLIEDRVKNNSCIIIRLPSVYGLIAVYYSRKLHKKYLVEVVGCPWDILTNHSIKGKILAPFITCLTKNAVKNAPFVLYVTNSFLQRKYPTKGYSIGCSDVSLPYINEKIMCRRLNKINANKREKPLRLGTLASVNVRYKGQKYVIEAISILNKKGYNFEYYLAGGGDDTYLRSIVKKYNIEDKVHFLGALPHEDIFEYIDNLDIYIQPSKTEGLPRALIEAMSRGCPAIGSKTGGIPELLKESMIFEKCSVNELTYILSRINKEIMLKESSENFIIASEYSERILSEKREKFYRNYLKGINEND